MARHFRGHGWSNQGTKASRRLHRKQRKKQWYYAVAVGHRPGIYLDWASAKSQVHEYPDNVHAKFISLEDARSFMYMNREYPPAVCTPFPPHSDTPLPPPDINPQYRNLNVNVDAEVQIPPYIAVGPADVSEHLFLPVRQMAERIADDPANRVEDPGGFECSNSECNFCTGDRMGQRFALMKRLYQLNVQLVVTDGAGGTRSGQSDHDMFSG